MQNAHLKYNYGEDRSDGKGVVSYSFEFLNCEDYHYHCRYTLVGYDEARKGNLPEADDHIAIIYENGKYVLDNGVVRTTEERTSELIVKDYFKKGLYANIAKIDDMDIIASRLIDPKAETSQSKKFYNLIQASTIHYDIDETVKNKITGTKFNDLIVSGNRDDSITGGAGNDVITPNAGDNIVKTGSGNDIVKLGYGNNTIYLESGNNVIVYDADNNISGYDKIYSGKGHDIIELTSKKESDLDYEY